MSTYYFNINPDYDGLEPGSIFFTKDNPGSYIDLYTFLKNGTVTICSITLPLEDGDTLRIFGEWIIDPNIGPSTFEIADVNNLTLTSWQENVPWKIFSETSEPSLEFIFTGNEKSMTIQNGIFSHFDLGGTSTSPTTHIDSLRFKNCVFYSELIMALGGDGVDFIGCTFTDVNNGMNFIVDNYTDFPINCDFYDCVFIGESDVNTIGSHTTLTYNYCTFETSAQQLGSDIDCDFDWVPAEQFPLVENIEESSIIYNDYDVTITSTDDRTSYWEDNNVYFGFYGNTRTGRGAFSFSDTTSYGHIGSYYFGGDYENSTPDISIPQIELEVLSENFISIGATPTFDIPEINISPIDSNIDSNIVTTSDFCTLEFSAAPLSGGTPLTVKFTAYGQKSNVEISEYRWWFEHNITSGFEDYISCAGPEAYHTYCGSYLQQYDVKLLALCKKLEPVEDILIDGDGNEYTTVVIGSQVWIVENWRSTKYADGTPIPHLPDDNEWEWLSTPAYCWYNNDPSQGYGALYSWYVVDPDNPKSIAPEGWRVPTDADWTALEDYLIANGYNWDGTTEGNKIAKALASDGGEWDASGTEGAVGNDQSSNNSSGFSARPGGFRFSDGNFYDVGTHGSWWSATEYSASSALYRYLIRDGENVTRLNNYKGFGYSVRLVRDIYI